MQSNDLKDFSLVDQNSKEVYQICTDKKFPWADCSIRADTTSAESHTLYKLVKDTGAGNYADIGALFGGSTCTMGHALNEVGKGVIYSIDYFGTGPKNNKGIKSAPSAIEQYFTITFKRAKVKVCIGTSEQIGLNTNETFNGIFIDAGHDYDNCKKDFTIWGEKVRLKGWAAFHDCHFLDVNKVITEIDLTKWQFIKQVYTLKVFKKIRV